MPHFTVIDAETLEVLRFGWVEDFDMHTQSTAPNEVTIEGMYDDTEWDFVVSPTGLEPVKKTL